MRPRRLLGSAALLLLLVLAALMLAPPLLGFERYVIEGGSMGAALPRGSIAYEEVVATRRIRVGDVITYRPPRRGSHLVTHRVAWVGREPSGARRRLYRTRGDGNANADPWTFRLAGARQARVVFHVPYAGYAIAALSVRWVRMAVVGGPALVIAICALAPLVRRRAGVPDPTSDRAPS